MQKLTETQRADLLDELEQRVAEGLRWLRMRQPTGAVVSHHGISSAAGEGSSRTTVQVIPQGHAGTVVLVFGIPEYGPPKDGELTYGPRFTLADCERIRLAARRGGATILNSWNGRGCWTYSLAIEGKLAPTLRAALNRYHAGCPSGVPPGPPPKEPLHYSGSVFCGNPRHAWQRGFKLLRVPKGWS